METEINSSNKSVAKQIGEAALIALTYLARFVVWVQGTYYMLMGLWPLLNAGSFVNSGAPKIDIWLVKTVGTLLIVSGFVLVLAAYRRRVSMEIAVLGMGNALALLITEMVYVFRGIISPIYILDALVEILLILSWFRRGGPYD